MLILRLIGVLLVISIAACFITYAFTRNGRYLTLAGLLLKYSVIAALLIGALFVLERVLVI
ncbi:hypothetical protein NMQ14_02220 [Methyloversatilis sp. XJ19-13]|uniref:hypothetical protein n=1 Tax=Methyloversatilis sp. XJ19-13 TaxID=2963430 RepID=UPI00211CA899|nr:hypothetical protein [Methyloversatilis sp. XJ19-13]MCQ9373062.1 hypothetical protein [Methyloversatilis sp. XJ19-13]